MRWSTQTAFSNFCGVKLLDGFWLKALSTSLEYCMPCLTTRLADLNLVFTSKDDGFDDGVLGLITV